MEESEVKDVDHDVDGLDPDSEDLWSPADDVWDDDSDLDESDSFSGADVRPSSSSGKPFLLKLFLIILLLGGGVFFLFSFFSSSQKPAYSPSVVTLDDPDVVDLQEDSVSPSSLSPVEEGLSLDSTSTDSDVTGITGELEHSGDVLTPMPDDLVQAVVDLPELAEEEVLGSLVVADDEIDSADFPEEVPQSLSEEALLSKTEVSSEPFRNDVPMVEKPVDDISDVALEVLSPEEGDVVVEQVSQVEEQTSQVGDIEVVSESVSENIPSDSLSETVSEVEDIQEESFVAPIPVQKKAVPKWVIRGAQSGRALIYDQVSGQMQTVEAGDRVRGVGRVQSIEMVGGRWVVQGTVGKIER